MMQFHIDFQLRKYSRKTVDAYPVRDMGDALGRLHALFPRHVAIAPWVSGGGKQHFFIVFETKEEASAAARADNEWQIIAAERHSRSRLELCLSSIMERNGGWLRNPLSDISSVGARDTSMENVLGVPQEPSVPVFGDSLAAGSRGEAFALPGAGETSVELPPPLFGKERKRSFSKVGNLRSSNSASSSDKNSRKRVSSSGLSRPSNLIEQIREPAQSMDQKSLSMPGEVAPPVSWPTTMSMSDSGTVMTATGAQRPPRRQPTMDPRIRPGVGPQQVPSPRLHILQAIQGNTPLPLAQQNLLQTPNQDPRAHPEILNHSKAGENQAAGASEQRNVPPCPPGAHPLEVGVGVAAETPSDEVVRTLSDKLGAERARGRKLEGQLACLSAERGSLIAERDAARAERDAVITVNMGLEAQILAVEKLLKGLESYALAGLWETATLGHTP